jgi:hypothetical protein
MTTCALLPWISTRDDRPRGASRVVITACDRAEELRSAGSLEALWRDTVSARLSYRSPIPLFQSSIAEKIRVDTFLAQERR